MPVTWSTLKDVFYTFGSIAGALALLRPLAESKMQRDMVRVERIKSIVNEQQLVDLERCVNSRQVPRQYFLPFDQIGHEIRTKQDGVRFSGPYAKYLTQELGLLIDGYQKLREHIQVPEWEPRTVEIEGVIYERWDFNKRAFEDENRISKNYAGQLYATEIQAAEMLRTFQRFQIVSELHLLEMPLSKWLLKRRFKARSLDAAANA